MVSYEHQGTTYDPHAAGYELQGRERPRMGDWIQSYTGRPVYPMDMRPEDIFVEDIAHALSMQCRYAGHCLNFYSTAEHCVLMTRWVRAQGGSPHDQMWALHHDDGETYLVDVPRPVKPFLVGYKEAEDRIAAAVSQRFGLSVAMPPIVKEADTRILFDEKVQNLAPGPDWSISAEPLGVTLQLWSPKEAEAQFLAEHYRIIEMGGF